MTKPRILLLGPLPPPLNGMSVVTNMMLESPILGEVFDLVSFDTSDHRPVSNQGMLDWGNVVSAIRMGISFWWKLISKKWDIIYVPIAQNTLGFSRDLLFLIPARWMRAKVIIHLHGGHFDSFYRGSGAFMKMLIRFGLKGVSMGIVLSPSLKYCLEPVLESRNIFPVSNGVKNLPDYTEVYNSERGPAVLYLGTLLKSKGVFTLAQAMEQVVSKIPGTQFVFAGDWFSEKERQETEDFIRQKNLAASVRFTGPVAGPAKVKLLREADLFVMPTYYPFEGQPLVLLEAMAASLPIVTTRLPAILDTLPEGEGTLYVDAQSPIQVAECIVELLSDPEKRKKMGAMNRNRYLKQYTQEAFVQRMQGAFSLVLEGK